jgi:Mrp family chromosome partitioning ATPase
MRHQSTNKDSGRLAIQLLGQVNAPVLGGILNLADGSRTGYGAYVGHYRYYSRPPEAPDTLRRME